jgi:uncharacterized membrane protein YkvA (DUF1232 family)
LTAAEHVVGAERERLSALGYFVVPVDAIPIAGYGDDLGALACIIHEG